MEAIPLSRRFPCILSPILILWAVPVVSADKGDPNLLEGFRTISAYYRDLEQKGSPRWWRPPFALYRHNSSHDFPADCRALAYSWLEQQLRPALRQ